MIFVFENNLKSEKPFNILYDIPASIFPECMEMKPKTTMYQQIQPKVFCIHIFLCLSTTSNYIFCAETFNCVQRGPRKIQPSKQIILKKINFSNSTLLPDSI